MQVIDPAAPAPSALKATPLVLGAIASAGAGLVHAAAAGSHDGERTLAIMFALAAVAQLGWAAVALARPGRVLAGVGVALNLGLVAVWFLTRTVGIAPVAVLATVEAPGFQDTVAAALVMAALALALWSLATDALPEWLHRSSVATVAAVLVMAVTVPAVAAGHDHGDEATDELVAITDDEPGEEAPNLVAEGVAFVEPAADALPDPDSEPDAVEHDHDDGPVISLYDPRVTPEQREAARQLIDDTREGMERFPDIESVIAEGYISIGDGITGFEHFIQPLHAIDEHELNPDRIESIVARVNPDGSRDVVSAMYLMAPGNTMDDVPEIAGPLTIWHDHQDLCWEGIQVVGTLGDDGSCPRGEFRPTPPMLHVWLEPHPCGPFAGLEGHGGGCDHDH